MEQTYNIYGGSNKANYDHCTISRETDKAIQLQTINSEGSYLHEYRISFWIPKSVFYKNLVNDGSFGNNVTLPSWFHLDVNRNKIN